MLWPEPVHCTPPVEPPLDALVPLEPLVAPWLPVVPEVMAPVEALVLPPLPPVALVLPVVLAAVAPVAPLEPFLGGAVEPQAVASATRTAGTSSELARLSMNPPVWECGREGDGWTAIVRNFRQLPSSPRWGTCARWTRSFRLRHARSHNPCRIRSLGVVRRVV